MSGSSARLAWPDLARGLSVILVVLHHVVRQMLDQAPLTWQPAAEIWSLLDEFLTPIRIPLFFFISGYLVARAVRGSLWGDRRAWVIPAYLYILWSTLLTLRLLAPGSESEHSFGSNLIGNLLLAGSGYWYLLALPIYFLYTFVTRRWPAWLAAAPLIVGLLARDPLTAWTQQAGYQVMDSASLWGSILANGLFFWIGARFGRDVAPTLTSSRGLVIAAAAVAYSVIQVACMLTGTASYAAPAASLLGIGLGVMLCNRVPESTTFSRSVRYVGKRTLPVYVAQFFFISVFSFVWTRIADLSMMQSAGALAWIYPLVVTGVIVGLSLVGYRLATATLLLRWLFVPPSLLTGTREKPPASAKEAPARGERR